MLFNCRILIYIIPIFVFFAGSLLYDIRDAVAVGVCEITVGKIALENTSMQFQFSAPAPGPGNFSLSSGQEKEFQQIEFGNEVMITEQVPESWILESVTCEVTGGNFSPVIIEIDNGVTIDCEGEGPPDQDPELSEIKCEFVNVSIDSIDNVPTLSEWGLITMVGILGIVGFLFMRRRKVTA